MAAVEYPIYHPALSRGDFVWIQYCDGDGMTQAVVAEVAASYTVNGDYIAIMARREVFDLIGHTACPEILVPRDDLPDGYDLGLVLIDECEAAPPTLRLVVDKTKDF